MKHGTFSFATIVLGFIMAFVGITKFDPLEAAQESLKNSINFGDTSSPIEVYVFTDWFCTACHEAEPEFEKFAENINGKAKLFFIDANIHDESMNFTPYNLSFMIYNKPEYFELRNSLFNISERTDSPNDNMIQKEVSTLGVNFKDLNYRDIALATKLFNKLKKQFAVTSTPTVIIINLDTKKGKKISGSDDITETNILKAISDLN